MMRRLGYLLALLLLLAGCSKEDPIFILPGQTLQVEPVQVSIRLGTTQQYKATLIDENGVKSDVTASATWTSSDPAIASIDTAGLVTAIAVGSVTISADVNGARASAALDVNNKSITAISVFPGDAVAIAGLTKQYRAVAVFSDDSVQDVTADVAWSSDNNAAATIDARGVATAAGPGTAMLTAAFSGSSGSGQLRVLSATPSAFVIEPANAALKVGQVQQFNATLVLSTGEEIDISTEVTWATANFNVAVAANDPGNEGRVLATGPGATTVFAVVKAGAGQIVASAAVDVTEAVVVSLQVSPQNLNVPVGSFGNFQAVAFYDDGSFREVSRETSWLSSDTGVGVILSDGPNAGLALAVGQGRTTVTASFQGVADTSDVEVTAPVLQRVEVQPYKVETVAGLDARFRAFGIYSDFSVIELTTAANWSTADSAIAVMNPNDPGQAQTLAAGTTDVVAEYKGQRATGSLVVTSKAIRDILVYPGISSSIAGLDTQYSAVAVYNDNSVQDITREASWTSSDKAIATVNASGLATATGSGDATISAAYAGGSGTAVLHVLGAVPVAFTVSPTTATVKTGTTQPYRATLKLSSGEFIDITSAVFWATADSAVASVSNAAGNAGLATATGAGTTLVFASIRIGSNDFVASASITVTAAAVTALQITPAQVNVPVGTYGVFSAIAYFDDGSSRDVTREAYWSSSDTSVGVIFPSGDNAGLALAVGPGSANVTATFKGLVAIAEAQVSAAIPVRIQIQPRFETTPVGLTVRFNAVGVYSDFSVHDVTALADWSTSDPSVAVMASDDPGVAQGNRAGATQVVAELNGLTDQADLTVTAATATGIVIRQRDSEIYLGAGVFYIADVTLSDGTVIATGPTSPVTWQSGDNGVVTFIQNRANSVGQGTTSVTVTYTDPSGSGPPLTDTTSVTVTAPIVSDLQVQPASASIAAGQEQAFTATARYSDGSVRDVTAQSTWTSADSAIATIDTGGAARGESSGTVTISAKFGLYEDTATLTVSPALLQRLEVVPFDITMAVGDQREFNAIAYYTDRVETVTFYSYWSSTDPATALVGNLVNAGRVNALAAGTASITADFGGMSASSTVTVNAPALVSIQVKCDPTLDVGATGECTATGTYSDGQISDVTDTAVWTSSNTGVITVYKDDALRTATLFGESPGSADATATQAGVIGSQAVTVKDIAVTGITVTSPHNDVLVNDTEPFTATAVYSDLSTRDITRMAAWSSSNDSVMEVSNALIPGRGVGTATGAGNATITAVFEGLSGSKTITVLPNTPGIDEFTMSCNKGPQQGPSEIMVGQKVRCEAYATINGVVQNVTTTANWSVADVGIAAIDGIVGGSQKMDIVGVSAGETQIRAEYQGFTAAHDLIVR